MRYARHLVRGMGWFYVCFGLCFAVAPGFFLRMATGEMLDTAAGTTEIRAVYGGMGIGAGIWMLLCLGESVRLGLMGGALTSGGIAVFRVAGLLIDGNPTPFSILFLGAELGIVVAAISGLRAHKRLSTMAPSAVGPALHRHRERQAVALSGSERVRIT